MTKLQGFNLFLRGLMETGIVLGLGYWGYHTGNNTGMKILGSIGAPLLGFGFWGMVDFHQFEYGEYFRLIQELIISGLTAYAIYMTGQHLAGWSLVMLSLIHHALVYSIGDTLLKS